jgi:hypothetical protein
MIQHTRSRWLLRIGMLAALAGALAPSDARAQEPKAGATPASSTSVVTIEQPDARRTREQLASLLERYPPALRQTLALDPALLNNQSYLAPYPALVSFLNAHPEVARNPSFYVGESGSRFPQDYRSQVLAMWNDVLGFLGGLAAFGLAIAVVVWLIRTIVDYRRWSRLAKVQADAHTKLLDRFTKNEELLAYIQSPAGSKFLESSPIKLDAGPRSVGAPLGRILWSVQGGLVLVAAGVGLLVVSGWIAGEASQPFQVLGALGIALGIGLVISAIIAFAISHRLGLIERPSAAPPGPGGFGLRQ